MKKITKILALLAVFFTFAVAKSKAQDIYVRARLERPARYADLEYHHPPRPSARHVWVSEDWVNRGGRYDYRPGYWAVPPSPNAWWIRGRWVKRPAAPGYKWVNGHWGYGRR